MPFLEWSSEYSVNISKLDEQHKNLIDMANELDKSINSGNDKASVKPILDRLLDYTAYHFIAEERLLEQYGYPDLLRHKNEHNVLSWQVLELRSKYEAGDDVDAKEVLDFMSEWLKNHILHSDKKYGIFLNSRGVL